MIVEIKPSLSILDPSAPSEYAIIELQGEVVTTSGEAFDGKLIGELETDTVRWHKLCRAFHLLF